MAFQKQFKVLAAALFAAALSYPSIAAPISSCSNNPGSPTVVGGVLTTSYTCNLFNDSSLYTIDLTPFMTQGGASLADNLVGAGYVVVISGNPLTISANDTNDAALFNTALWDTVLFFPGDQGGGTESDKVTVFWPGAFPLPSIVRTLDESLYGAGLDSQFFAQLTGAVTTRGAGTFETYNIFTAATAATPEPSSIVLMLSGVAGMVLIGQLQRRRDPLSNEG